MLTYLELTVGRDIKSEIDNIGYPAAIKYLRDRGIPTSLIEDLGIRILPASEVIGRARGVPARDDRLAIIFPHFDHSGDYIEWWSSRLVEVGFRPSIVSISNLVPTRKKSKMFCPPNEAPHAYLPPILDWAKIERGDKVYIHESVIKSMNGAMLDYWSIGLNGVWGWTSKKHGQSLSRELLHMAWRAKELKPIIVFDSNAADNDDIKDAIICLAARLFEITGVRAKHLLLPKSPEGTNWGFDDFCVRHGEKISKEFLDSEAQDIDLDPIELMKIQLNTEVCVVRDIQCVVEQATGVIMTTSSFINTNYNDYTASVIQANGVPKKVNVPKLWMADQRRTEAMRMTYAPGEDKMIDGDLNTWRGMGLEPQAGDVKLWLELLETNVPNPELRKWVEAWFAYPLQQLGKKMTTFLHLFGPPGTGKQALLHPIVRIFGDNAVTVSRREIASDFNAAYANKQFINLDEIHGGSGRDGELVSNKIKMLVTGGTMIVNAKNKPEYEVPNVANLVTTSNHMDGLRIDMDDRRAAVIRFGARGGQWVKDKWDEYFAWADGDGAAALYAHLLSLDIGWFNPYGSAPVTEDKRDVVLATRTPIQQWVIQLDENPDEVLPPICGHYCLMTNEELAQYALGDHPMGVTPSGKKILGDALRDLGFSRTGNVKIARKTPRFWVIRKKDEKWEDPVKIRNQLKLQAFPGA